MYQIEIPSETVDLNWNALKMLKIIALFMETPHRKQKGPNISFALIEPTARDGRAIVPCFTMTLSWHCHLCMVLLIS